MVRRVSKCSVPSSFSLTARTHPYRAPPLQVVDKSEAVHAGQSVGMLRAKLLSDCPDFVVKCFSLAVSAATSQISCICHHDGQISASVDLVPCCQCLQM
jgi:hypothetical protein